MMPLDSRNAPSLDLPARFMALGIAAFSTAVLISPWALPLIQDGVGAFTLLAFVHLLTLGFVGAMIIGASYQLVPVVVQAPLASVRLGRISFWFYLTGLALFLSGLLREWLPGLSIGGTVLGAAFTFYIWIVFATILRAPHRDAIAWHIMAGALFSGVGMAFGVLLAFNKSSGFLGGRLLDMLAAHMVVMLGGWVGLTFIGVAYRLVGMFTLAEKHLQARWLWAGLALIVVGVTTVALHFLPGGPSLVGETGATAILAGVIIFAAQVRRLYQRRMRRTFDIHIPFAVAAVTMMLLAATSLLGGLLLDVTPAGPFWRATVWLALVGVAGTAIQGFFYKIATFLVWLKRYAPVAGRQQVPRLEEMYSRRFGVAGLGFWLAAIALGWLVLLLGLPMLTLVGLLMIVGAGCFIVNVAMIARNWRAPAVALPSWMVLRPGLDKRA